MQAIQQFNCLLYYYDIKMIVLNIIFKDIAIKFVLHSNTSQKTEESLCFTFLWWGVMAVFLISPSVKDLEKIVEKKTKNQMNWKVKHKFKMYLDF